MLTINYLKTDTVLGKTLVVELISEPVLKLMSEPILVLKTKMRDSKSRDMKMFIIDAIKDCI